MYENISPSSTALYGTVLYLYSRVLKFLLKMGIQPSMLGLVTMMGPSEKHIPDGSPLSAFWDGFKQFKHAKITKIWSFPKISQSSWQYPNPSYHPVVIYSPWLSNLNPRGDDWETPTIHPVTPGRTWPVQAPAKCLRAPPGPGLITFSWRFKDQWQKWCIFNV